MCFGQQRGRVSNVQGLVQALLSDVPSGPSHTHTLTAVLLAHEKGLKSSPDSEF